MVGPNEVGKSFAFVELPRYLLYGKAALRGMAGDYKTLDATGVFEIRGKTYTISRSAKREQIVDEAGAVLAVNADAVTNKVIELMGYGLAVFDIANASVQKHADLFGKLRPAERKRLIDQVVGVTSNEVAEKACRTEAAGFKREAEAMTKTLRAPVAVEKPEGYEDSRHLGRRLAEARAAAMSYERLSAQIRGVPTPVKPERPRPAPERLAQLQEHEKARNDADYRRAALAPLAALPAPSWTSEQMDIAEQRLAYREEIARRENDHKATCPNCNHEFPLVAREPLPDNPPGADLTRAQIRAIRDEIARYSQAAQAKVEMEALPQLDDLSAELLQYHKDEAAHLVYANDVARAEELDKANAEIERQIKALGPVLSSQQLEQMNAKLMEARLYEHSLETYEAAKSLFDETSASITEAQRLADEFKKGADALADARATLKAHLAPALSRVASKLLRDMTYGKRQSIIVDQNMEIAVDGQRIETLSGGAETVANIALRIALGQVLVSQTFPVFLGDEMDADTDALRREAVVEAMVALKDHLSQIILVTHRDVSVADQVFDLSNTV